MRKWAFFFVAAAIAVIGCGGNGDSGSSTNGATGLTGTTGSSLRVTIPTPPGYNQPPGRLEFGYLTGQGRAVGDLTLAIARVSVRDEFGEVRSDLNARANLALSSYSFQTLAITVPFTGQNSRLFESYQLDADELIEETDTGFRRVNCFAILQPDGSFVRSWPPNPVAMNARVFSGRSTLVPVFLDDSMFQMVRDQSAPLNDPCGGYVAVFDEERFLQINQSPLEGFINDYVSFDLSAMPADRLPRLSGESGGQLGARVFVSGDNFAVAPAGETGPFEVLTEFVSEPIIGTFRVPSQLPGATTPGTFTLRQLDPTDLLNLRKIVALQGIWRENNTVIGGQDAWNMVSFPTSRDGFEQEVVFFRRQGNQITDFYFGFVNYDNGQIRLFPVKDLVTGLVTPGEEVIGRVTAQFDRNNGVTIAPQETRSATFQIDTRGALPGDAPSTGTMLVFRI